MKKCCSGKEVSIKKTDPCCPQQPELSGDRDKTGRPAPVAWFDDMVPSNLAYAKAEKAKGKKVVGIMCEYTPRELIMAAGALPVCLCGGDVNTIPAAEDVLPANLCPLIKSTYGYSVLNSNPFLDLLDLIVAETTCDGKKKMYELLSERHPMAVLELPQKPDSGQAFELWLAELRKLKKDMEKRFNVAITKSGLEKAIRAMNEERALKRKLAGLMKSEQPPLTGHELLDMKSLISCIPADMEKYKEAAAALEGRQPESAGTVTPVRVLLTGVPLPHGAERVMEIIEDNGGRVVCQENCTGLKPLVEDVEENTDDPLRAIALKYFHLPCSVMTANEARLDLLRSLVKEYRPQCIVELTWQTCITYDIESHRVKKLAEDELGLPYLKIETDYSPSDSARIAMRIQALFETVAARGE